MNPFFLFLYLLAAVAGCASEVEQKIATKVHSGFSLLPHTGYIVSVDKGDMVAFDSDWKERWRYSGVAGTKLWRQAQVLVNTKTQRALLIGNGIALVDFNGREVWRNAPVNGKLARDGQAVFSNDQSMFFTIQSGDIQAYSVDEGKPLWVSKSSVLEAGLSIAQTNDIVSVNVLGNMDCHSYDGIKLWTKDIPARVDAVATADPNKGSRMFFCNDHSTGTVDSKGNILMQGNGIRHLVTHAVCVTGHGVVAVGGEYVGFFDPAGAKLWEAEPKIGSVERVFPLSGGRFAVTSEDEGMAVYNASGQMLLRKLEPSLISTPVIEVSKDRIAYGTANGLIHLHNLPHEGK